MPRTADLATLDQDELFQLAVNASQGGDSASAIACLKQAVARDDATAKAHYLLGAEYAQIRMYERAVELMASALALDPTLSVARLQLGLLWLAAADTDRAASVLAPLAELPEGEPLRYFGAGLCHLIGDRIAEARAHLELGIARNTAILPLNVDMRRILDEMARLAAGQGAAAADSTKAHESEDGRHILLSAYTGNTSH
ncbi:hypothetical protein [Massilia sp. TSP1-1-2]|uniref:hypothetical protein n=1 Tax=Massilia sp. TSP1-1-2 TaxID=2804649 RepID=UPI003CF36DB6